MPDFSFQAVDSAFQNTCRVLFGKSAGSLERFGPYLSEAMAPCTMAKSSASGRGVFLSNPFYPKGARFLAPNEIPRPGKVGINDIKDIDSLFRAAGETFAYCGNKVFRKNINVELVDNAIDCVDVYRCHNVRNVKRAAHASYVRESENVFGIPAFPKINWSMRCLEGINANRMFETYYTNHSSDMYYSFNCYSCSDVIFGFNLRGKRHVIGNVQLESAKYSELKKKLLMEMAGELEKKKRAPSVSDLMRTAAKDRGTERWEPIPTVAAPVSVEKAWENTTSIVLGKPHAGIREFAPWLQKNAVPVAKLRGKFGSDTYRPSLPLVKDMPGSCLCTREEALKEDGPLASKEEVSLPLAKLRLLVAGKASITMEMEEGESREVPEVTQAIDSTECYAMWDATSSKRSALGSAAIQSSYVFGGYLRMLDSEFCINCYDVTKTKRSLECDGLSECSNCYFCHNLEGCEECILCCNAKGLRFAVLNTQLPREEYARIKEMLLSWANRELGKGKTLPRTVFSLPG